MTLCQRCGKNPAVLHLTRLVNGHRQELHLCMACAQGADPPDHKLNLIALMKTMLAMEQPDGMAEEPREAPAGPRCPGCGFTLEDIRRTGRMGCARCYGTFRAQIEPVLLRVQGRIARPARQEGMASAQSPDSPVSPRAKASAEGPAQMAQRLRGQMQEAVEKEEYERAAQIRDELKALEGREEKDGNLEQARS